MTLWESTMRGIKKKRVEVEGRNRREKLSIDMGHILKNDLHELFICRILWI